MLSFLDAVGESQVERAGFGFLTGGRVLGDAPGAGRAHGAELVEELKVCALSIV